VRRSLFDHLRERMLRRGERAERVVLVHLAEFADSAGGAMQ
jgi:hypothetical protein